MINTASTVDIAGATHKKLFIGYLVWLFVAAVITGVFSWVVWVASNREQSAVIAATNERAQSLENENLKLQETVAVLTERAAKAEHSLLELQQRIQKQQSPRIISPEQHHKILNMLSVQPKTRIVIFQMDGDDDSLWFAESFRKLLQEDAGWDCTSRQYKGISTGIRIEMEMDNAEAKQSGLALVKALQEANLDPQMSFIKSPDNPLSLIIGHKALVVFPKEENSN